jgi:hypothetical protein
MVLLVAMPCMQFLNSLSSWLLYSNWAERNCARGLRLVGDLRLIMRPDLIEGILVPIFKLWFM